jgi:hypothetical protein
LPAWSPCPPRGARRQGRVAGSSRPPRAVQFILELARFSNQSARVSDDSRRDIRGAAIKLLDVDPPCLSRTTLHAGPGTAPARTRLRRRSRLLPRPDARLRPDRTRARSGLRLRSERRRLGRSRAHRPGAAQHIHEHQQVRVRQRHHRPSADGCAPGQQAAGPPVPAHRREAAHPANQPFGPPAHPHLRRTTTRSRRGQAEPRPGPRRRWWRTAGVSWCG